MNKKFKKIIKKILKSPLTMKLIAYVAYAYTTLVYKTCRWEGNGIKEVHNILEKNKNSIVIGWHGRIVMTPLLLTSAPKTTQKDLRVNALVSPHQDGMIMSNYLKHFNVGIVGGSSNRNAKGAALSLMNSIKDGKTIFIVPDGPVGPNMKMTPSPIYFAQKSQRSIYFITFSIYKAKILKNVWDDMMIPKPFSKGKYRVLGPFNIPENATDEDLEKHRIEIEEKANSAVLELDKEMEVEPVEIGKISRKKRKNEG